MKILIVTNMYPSTQKPYSGIFVKNQFEGLQKLLTGDDSISIFYMKRTFTGKLQSIIKYLKAFFEFIPNYFKHHDIVHLHFFMPLIIPVIFIKLFHRKTKVIVTFHGSDIRNYFNNKISKKIFSYVISKVNYVIAVGSDLHDEIELKLNRKSDLVLSAGVDQNKFYAEHSVKLYDFIFVGSFIERKGVDKILEAIKIIDDTHLKYCFVGSGKLLDSIKETSKKYNITIKENMTQQQLRKLFNESKYFILPSNYEPFGLVATEAIFCGTPAITSSVGGLKEQIIEGKNGYFIKETTPAGIAQKIKEVSQKNDQAYDQLVESTLQSNKEFSMDNVLNKLIEVYNHLTREKI